MIKTGFESLGLSLKVLKAIEDLGFEEMTQIQAKAIPCLLNGRDIIGNSHTGSGKTAAFVIPVLERIDTSNTAVQALILCPTRELALQITDEIRKFSKYMDNIRSLAVYGGEPIIRQMRELKKWPQIVIGTPGRVMDHMRRNTLKTGGVNMLVLDEADEMLNMGFREDIETIIKDISPKRQTMLFSATMPKAILDISRKYLSSPEQIKVQSSIASTPKIEESYFEIRSDAKDELLVRLIQLETPSKALVFCNTKSMTDQVAANLKSSGIKAEPIHGDIQQFSRTDIMRRFKSGMFNVLVATDVAARGIDVDDIEIVFNYDIPIDREYYTHRIGRTARAGKTGKSYTFVSGQTQMRELREIMKYTKSAVKLRKNPSYNEIHAKRVKSILENAETGIGSKGNENYKKAIDEVLDGRYSYEDLACALLKMTVEGSYKTGVVAEDITDAEVSRFHMNLGRKDRIDKNKIMEFLTRNNDVSRNDIGDLNLYKNFSYIDIPRRIERKVLDSLKNEYYNGRRIRLEPALKKTES